MAEDDWKRRFVDEVYSNPAVAATVLGAAGTMLGLMLGAKRMTPEDRRAFKQRQVKRQREAVQERRDRERERLREKMRCKFFENGPGKNLAREQGLMVFPASAPFPDGTFETFEASGFRGSVGGGFIAASESAGARFSLTHDTSEGPGGFRLHRPDGSSWVGEYGSIDPLKVDYAPYYLKQKRFDELIEDAKLIARLIAAPGSHYRQVSLQRLDYETIREAIWNEHLRENPHIAATFED
jgi:hypothetical protein